MKVSCLNSVKFLKLKRRLKLKQWQAIGVLEAVWLFTQNNAPGGNIGRMTNEDIAAGIEWDGDADELVGNLIECGFIDEADCLADRLVIHDWEHHCPTWLKGALAKNNKTFSPAKNAAKQSAKQDKEQDAKHGASLPSVTLPSVTIYPDRSGTEPLPESLKPFSERPVEPLPANSLNGTSVFDPIKATHLGNTATLIEWHRRQLSAHDPVMEATQAGAITTIAAGLYAIGIPETKVKKSRVAVFVNVIQQKRWSVLKRYIPKAIEEFRKATSNGKSE